MGFVDREQSALRSISLGTLTVTATNETLRAKVPSVVSGPLLQSYALSQYQNIAEVWVPVGISYVVTTAIAANATTAVTLWKNGVAVVGTGGVIVLPAIAAGANHIFAPFGNYTLATAAAAGDAWSLKVTVVADTTGIINPVYLWYATKQITAINEGISV